MHRRFPILGRAAALLLCILLPACHAVEDEPTALARAAATHGDGAPGQPVPVEAGIPASTDPRPLDAGGPFPLDAGGPFPLDGGTPPMLDAGMPPMLDAGTPPMLDAGTPPMLDAGMPPIFDAGTPPMLDAGAPPPLDAGLPPSPDAGVPGCSRRSMTPWSPSGGELDARPFTEVELPRDPSDPGRHRWTLTVPGAVAQVRVAAPVMTDLPAYQLHVDHDGWFDACPGYTTIDAWFVAGIYTVDVIYADGRSPSLFTLFAGAVIPAPNQVDIPLPGAKEKKDSSCAQHARWSQIPAAELQHDPGAFVIEETTSDNTYIARAAAVMGDGAVRAPDVPTAVTKLEAAYTARRGAVAAVLVGHGANSAISVGAGQSGQGADTYLFMKGHRANTTFKDGLTKNGTEQHVRRVALVGCCVAGLLHDLKKDHLICDLARGLAPVGETEILAWMSKTNVVEASGNRAGYFTVAGAEWGMFGRRIKKGHCDQW